MRRFLFIVFLLLITSSARANPINLGAGNVIAFPIVVASALVVEAGVVALLLLLSGLAPAPTFGGYFVTNLVVFGSLFSAQFFGHTIPIPLFEVLAVTADAVCIKLLSVFEPFQGDDFQGVSWLRAGLISCAGNSTSFFVGLAAQRLF
jgi:hypothetical protein